MKTYEVGIVYVFQADDEEHAVEQFLDANSDLGSVNYMREVEA